MSPHAWQRAVVSMSAVVITAIIITALYVGRVVLIPIAMAIFFTYVLSPVVSFWQRRGFNRTTAVAFTVGFTAVVVFGLSFTVTRELANLSDTVADRAPVIREKIARTKSSLIGNGDSRFRELLDELERTFSPQQDSSQTVVLEPRRSSWTPRLEAMVSPATELFGQAAFTMILVIFMLWSRTDLADRLLRLIGDGQMMQTTMAMNDASQRISRYLFRQLVVNATFGGIVTVMLYAIGLPNALLWGLFIFLMRYVPYIGTWVGVIPPFLFAIAVGEDWSLPILTLSLILGLETIVNNFVEPYFYGPSLGVSEVALLISAAFWAFLWGPVGLILSGPITSCLLVLGSHAPPFRFLKTLLGNEPPLTPDLALFHRLASGNPDEAQRLVETALKKTSGPEVMDNMLIPALAMLKNAKQEHQFSKEEETQIIGSTREVIEESLEEHRKAINSGAAFRERTKILICPAHDEYDALALEVLQASLPLSKWEVQGTSVKTMTSELLVKAQEFGPRVVVIGSLPPGGVTQARYLCKRLRARLPGTMIVVGRWTGQDSEDDWKAIGADKLAASVAEASRHLQAWEPALGKQENGSQRSDVKPH